MQERIKKVNGQSAKPSSIEAQLKILATNNERQMK